MCTDSMNTMEALVLNPKTPAKNLWFMFDDS